jgi:hypothetical protein
MPVQPPKELNLRVSTKSPSGLVKSGTRVSNVKTTPADAPRELTQEEFNQTLYEAGYRGNPTKVTSLKTTPAPQPKPKSTPTATPKTTYQGGVPKSITKSPAMVVSEQPYMSYDNRPKKTTKKPDYNDIYTIPHEELAYYTATEGVTYKRTKNGIKETGKTGVITFSPNTATYKELGGSPPQKEEQSITKTIFDFDAFSFGQNVALDLFGVKDAKKRIELKQKTQSFNVVKSAGKNTPFESPEKFIAGFVGSFEGVVNPNVPSFMGSAISDVVTLGQAGSLDKLQKKQGSSYVAGSIVGEGVQSFLIGKAVGKAVKVAKGTKTGKAVSKAVTKVTKPVTSPIGKGLGSIKTKTYNQLVGSKVDDFLLGHSKSYKNWATQQIKPQAVSTPVFDVGQKGYTWSPARQSAIDFGWGLEMTPKSSGVTANLLQESVTKTKILPHLISRGGQVSIGVLRDTGFSKIDDSLQNAPRQFGVQTTITKTTGSKLSYLPPSILGKTSQGFPNTLLGLYISGSAKNVTRQKSNKTVVPEIVSFPSMATVLKPETKTRTTLKQIPYLPQTTETLQQQKEQQTLIPKTVLTPQTIQQTKPTEITETLPEVTQIPEAWQKQPTQQEQAVIIQPQSVLQQAVSQTPRKKDTLRPPPQILLQKPSSIPPVWFGFRKYKYPKQSSQIGEVWRIKRHAVLTPQQAKKQLIGEIKNKKIVF